MQIATLCTCLLHGNQPPVGFISIWSDTAILPDESRSLKYRFAAFLVLSESAVQSRSAFVLLRRSPSLVGPLRSWGAVNAPGPAL